MHCVIIFKKDLDRFGKNLMKDFYDMLHQDYMLTFEQVKKAREVWDKYLVEKFKDFYKNKSTDFYCLYYEYLSYEDLDKMSHKDLLKKIEEIIKDKEIDLEIIEYVLSKLEIDYELNEDIIFNQKAFIYLYNVYHYYHSYLKD